MTIDVMHPAEQICTVMKRIYARQYTTLSGGNLSVMDETGVMWVSPSGIDKSSLTPDDIVQVYPDGSYKGRHKPTSEYLIHREIYKVRPDIRAVLHAHPPAMTAMSTLHEVPDTLLYPSAWLNHDEQVAVYGLPGSQVLAERVAEVFRKGSNTAVLENHGVFMAGKSHIFDVFGRFDELEENAFVQMNAEVFGKPCGIPEELMKKIAGNESGFEQSHLNSLISTEEKNRRKEMSDIAKRAYENKLFTALGGTLAVKTGEDTFLISPEQKDNAYLEPEDFVKVSAGKYEGQRRPDKLAGYVRKVFACKPEIQGIIFAAPAYTMMFAVTDEPYNVDFIPECRGVLFNCRTYTAEEYVCGQEKIIDESEADAPFALIKNIGAVYSAVSLHSAYDMMEVCENTAKSVHMARLTGKQIRWLTQEQIREMDGK